ncbi:MAG TPA: hypothetical protein VFJ17_10625 [Mycobacteriales bacterium]|nr:hypothetical protein [Mycobacteriales bacterium]
MRITQSLRLTATTALSALVATLAFAGPLAGSALAAPKPKAPLPSVTATVSSTDSTPLGSRTASPTAHFSWSVINGETYTCFLDGASKTTCTTSADYSGIASGTHTFTIKVGRLTGYRPNTYVYTWVVDRTPPMSPPAVDPLPTPTSNTSVNVTFSKVDPSTASFECALDDAVAAHATTCSSPWAVTNLTEQSHTAYVYAVDDLGNVNTTAGTVTWVVDHTAPSSPTVSVTPVGPTSSTDATITWVDGDAVSFSCQLDAAAPVSPCTTPWLLHNLSEGTHVVAVTGTDAAGNVGSAGKVHWIVDLTPPPAPLITTGPASTTDNTMATFQFGDADATATFACKLDSSTTTGTYAPCSSPTTYLGPLADGNYVFSVRATDAAGNTGPASTWAWTVDTVNTVVSPPQIQTGPAPLTHDTSPTFTFLSLDDPSATFLCVVDPTDPSNQAAYSTCSSGDSFPVSVDGAHTLYVEEVSTGVSSLPATWNWTLDSSPPPAPTFTAKPDAFSNATGALFNFSDTEPNVSFVCQLDAQTPFACATPANVTQLGEGSHTFTVTATDAAGNTGPGSVASYSWTVDLTAPAMPTVTGADPSGTTATLAVSDSDADVVGYRCTLDSSLPASCTSAPSFSDLSGGSHTILVQAVDHAGNVGLPQPFTWTVDPGAPNAPSFDSTPAQLINSHTADFAFSDPATGDSHTVVTSFDCYIDNVKIVSGCTSTSYTGVPSGTMHLSGLGEGDHTFTVVGLNSLQNGNPASYPFTVDVTAPVITVLGLPNNSLVNDTSIATVVSDSDAHSSGAYTCSLTGPNGFSSTDCAGGTGLADGDYTFTADTTDLAGNPATTYSRSWTIDATAPVLDLTGLPAQDAVVNWTTFKPALTTTDAHSSGQYTCALDGPPVSCTDLGTVGEGAHTFTADTTDLAGNVAATLSRSFTVDRTAPATPSVTGTSGLVNTTTASFAYTDSTADVAFYSCSLDGAAGTACPSSYPGLGDGSHSLDVTATDAAGNVSAAGHATWTVDTGAPTARITTPATLTGASVVTWSEPVSGVDISKVVLKETNSGKVVPATVTCLSGGVAASCAGATSALKVTPTGRFVPGQYYLVSIASGAAQDIASNASLAATGSFRAQRTLQENTLPVVAAWRTVKASTAYGHRYATEHLGGAQATWAFRGRSITWWTVSGPTEGKAAVYVDGHRKAIVNNYAPEASYRVARTFKRLGAGRHVLTIRVLGVKGRQSGTGTSVGVDAFTVGKTRTNSPRLGMSWHKLSGTAYYGRHAVVANLKGEVISLTFRGTSIAWTTIRNRTQGKAAIYVDGVRKAIVDNYSTTSRTKVNRWVRGLTDSVHTVRIVVLGKHHKGGKGNNVTVDRFAIG